MVLQAGTHLGPYEIVSLLGKGGMGEVYEANDTRLHRSVAIKVLPEELSGDRRYRRRLEREAKTISQLQHPHVCSLYDVGSGDDAPFFLVMEHLEGQTLAERLRGGPLPLPEALRIGQEIAEAMEAAHRRGIVHRDLKPGNVMLTEHGTKVLDFGLAKGIEDAQVEVSPEASTRTAITQEGVRVGTVPYMAPEQLEGKRADARTDLWALGCVLYEMVTGERPFRGDTQASLIRSIMQSQPEPPSRRQPVSPKRLDHVLTRCLEKDPERRAQSARDVSLELESIQVSSAASQDPDQQSGSRASGDTAGESAPPRASFERTSGRRKVVLAGAAILIAAIAGLAYWMTLREPAGTATTTGLAPIRSLAVLPLENLSGDPEQEYFSDGMTEALITELAKIGALKVISRTSIMRYKGTRKPLPAIAGELGVDAVVEGTVFRANDEVRISAQLVHASDTHLWAESYERDLGNVLALQKEVARDIVERIEVALTAREASQLSTPKTVDPEVYEAILKGRFHQLKFSPEGLEKAMFWLQHAIELDPESALAHAWLANVYGAIGGWGDVRPLEVWPEAERLARRAVELDDTLAESHIASGSVLAFTHHDWDAGEQALRRALELNPNSADGYYNYALLRAGRGHLEEAVELFDRALELDPLSPGIVTDSALPLIWVERFEEAIERARSALEIAPDFWRANWVLSTAHAMKGEFTPAIEAARRAVQQAGSNVRSEANLAAVLGLAGEEEEARQRLLTLLDSADRRWLAPYAIATAHAGIGDPDGALEWLEKGYEEGDLFMLFLAVDPTFRRTVGDDPRYAELVHRLGLELIATAH